MTLACHATAAWADVGTSITVVSDDRFRGRSFSHGHPVATLSLSYDDMSGLYVAGAVDAVMTPSAPELLSVHANLGYAWKLPSGTVVDVGLVRSDYTQYYRGGTKAHYTEAYAGIVTDHVSAHLHYSPDYFRSGVSTLYTDVDAVARPAPNWRLTGHVGVLLQIAGPQPSDGDSTHYDWRLGIARRAGPFDLQVAWSGGGPDEDYYEGRYHGQSAVTVGASYTF